MVREGEKSEVPGFTNFVLQQLASGARHGNSAARRAQAGEAVKWVGQVGAVV